MHPRLSAVIGLVCGSVLFAASVPENTAASQFRARMSLSFERNAGQSTDRSAAWIGHASGYRVALGATGATITAPGHSDVVRMQLVGARANALSRPLEPLPGKTSYLIGNDPHRWIHDLDTWGRVEYREAYQGIDVAWYGNQGEIEYDFLLKPGADPNRIRVHFDGASKLALETGGNLRIETAAGFRLPPYDRKQNETYNLHRHARGYQNSIDPDRRRCREHAPGTLARS
jgi:hypothetical protein